MSGALVPLLAQILMPIWFLQPSLFVIDGCLWPAVADPACIGIDCGVFGTCGQGVCTCTANFTGARCEKAPAGQWHGDGLLLPTAPVMDRYLCCMRSARLNQQPLPFAPYRHFTLAP